MASHAETKFVKQYEPGTQARVEWVNGRIVDVVNGRWRISAPSAAGWLRSF
jgi:hypothetical protein